MFEELILLALAIVSLAFVLLYRAYQELRLDFKELMSKKQSMSVKYGKMSEQFIPLLSIYPHDEQNFRFIGSPIDGVQFNDDAVVLVEFKSAKAKLSPMQKHIKELVSEKKVFFEEIRIPEGD